MVRLDFPETSYHRGQQHLFDVLLMDKPILDQEELKVHPLLDVLGAPHLARELHELSRENVVLDGDHLVDLDLEGVEALALL